MSVSKLFWIGLIAGMLSVMVGCSNPVEEDYCPVVETGEVLTGYSIDGSRWNGIGVDDRTKAEAGMYVNVLTPRGMGLHRFYIQYVDYDERDGEAFLVNFKGTDIPAKISDLDTYEVVDCR